MTPPHTEGINREPFDASDPFDIACVEGEIHAPKGDSMTRASGNTPTPEQEAAFDRAMARFDAEADKWADEIRLVDWIKNIVQTGRLNRSAPDSIREKFIARQESLIDAFVRQTFVEGFMRGGDSRKEYDNLQTAALRADRDRLRHALRPFAAFAEKAEAFVEDLAKNGGSPDMPTTGFRLSDFCRARQALQSTGGE